MAKATQADITNEGFTSSQFALDVASWAGFIDPLLAETALLVEARVGTAVYASVDATVQMHIARAERFLACADLWLRRANRLDSNTAASGDDNKGRDFERFAHFRKQYLQQYEAEIAALPASVAKPTEISSAPAIGSLASSHFTPASPNVANNVINGHYQ